MRRRLCGSWPVLAAWLGGMAAWAATPFGITAVTETEVIVNGAAGAEVAVFSVWREVTPEHHLAVTRFEELIDPEVQTFRAPVIPPVSVWFAVNLMTGEVSVAAPRGLSVRELPDPPGSPQSPGLAGSGSMGLPAPNLELLWVRPAADGRWSAWAASVRDGDPDDADGASDGMTSFDASQFTEVLSGSGALPANALAGDLILAIQPRTLEVKEIRF